MYFLFANQVEGEGLGLAPEDGKWSGIRRVQRGSMRVNPYKYMRGFLKVGEGLRGRGCALCSDAAANMGWLDLVRLGALQDFLVGGADGRGCSHQESSSGWVWGWCGVTGGSTGGRQKQLLPERRAQRDDLSE